MTGPSLVASYPVIPGSSGSGALTTAAFTPSTGDLIIVKMTTWDQSISMGSPSGGSQTFTSRVINAVSGFHGWSGIYSAVISGSPGSMTIAASPSAAARCTLVAERWTGATLAGTPATDNANATGTSTLTTTAPNSVLSWCGLDENSRDPSTRTYAGSAIEDGLDDGHVGNNSVAYHAYQAVAAAGSTTYGVTSPTSLAISYSAIEILAAAAPSGPPIQNLCYNQAALSRAFNW